MTDKLFSPALKILLVLLPWQTVWIFQTAIVNGAKWEYGTLAFYLSEFFLLLLIAGAWYKKKIILKNVPAAFWLMFGYAILTILWADHRGLALQSFLHAAAAVGFFLLLRSEILSRAEIIEWLLLGAALPSLLGLYQFFSQSTFSATILGLAKHDPSIAGSSVIVGDTLGRWLRAYGSFSHPNVFGGYLAAVVLLFVSANFAGGRFLLYRILALIATMALTVTLSRSAWLVLSIGIVMVGFDAWRKNHDGQLINVFAVSLMFFVTLGIIHGLVGNRIFLGSAYEARSISERMTGWREAKELAARHPGGVGWGNYTGALTQTDPSHPGWYYQPVHLVPLLVLVEWGIVGFLFFLYWTGSVLWRIWRESLVYAFVGGLAIIGLMDHYMYTGYGGGLIGVLFIYGILSTVRPQLNLGSPVINS